MEDRASARADEKTDDDQDDPQKRVASDDRDDAPDHEDHSQKPEKEHHGCHLPSGRSTTLFDLLMVGLLRRDEQVTQ